MNKRLAAFLSLTLLLAGAFLQPAWTQTTTPAQPAQAQPEQPPLPAKFDLREVEAVTPVKAQQGGTCWTHGTMAAVESHLLISGKWKAMNMKGIPMLSEYHLDWWNGFNNKSNEDCPDMSPFLPTGKAIGVGGPHGGLVVHNGGDYRVAAAYISRGDGIVIIPGEESKPPDPKKWYGNPPPRHDASFKRLYVRDIEWFTIDDDLKGIELIKRRIMKEGALGTCYAVNAKFVSKEIIHYQPKDSPMDPNHSVAIVGWDDTIITTEDGKKAPKPGAWLIKNSWGEANKRTLKGYGWISYYDKHCARHPEMGAVSFRNVEPMQYDHVYYHDAHGWRDTLGQVSKAFNAFTATGRETLRAVSFYTTQHNVNYTVKVYGKFENGKLGDEKLSQTGTIEYCGFHTIDLRLPVGLKENDKFYVMVELSAGGHAIDRTSNIPVLLGQPGKAQKLPVVISTANPGESFYYEDGRWKDLYDYRFQNPDWATFDRTANFCIKGLCVKN